MDKKQLIIRVPDYIKTSLEELKNVKGGTVNQYVNNALTLYLTLIGKTPELDGMLDKFNLSIQSNQLDVKTLWDFKG